VTRCKQKPSGHQRKYDRSEILRGFKLGLSNVVIAENVGCTADYVWELRNREIRRKKMKVEGRL